MPECGKRGKKLKIIWLPLKNSKNRITFLSIRVLKNKAIEEDKNLESPQENCDGGS